jgi:hypothetical protein
MDQQQGNTMTGDKEFVSQDELLTIIEDYISVSEGLSSKRSTEGHFTITQKGDARSLTLKAGELADVLTRKDAEGKTFVQVNFHGGRKILLTEQLIGFKPVPVNNIDITKLPKVVTTLDLLSVFEAIEESISTASPADETEILKRVFQSILAGAEQAGFDLSNEKLWLKRLPTHTSKASA